MMIPQNRGYPVAGLVPAAHVFCPPELGSLEGVDARDKPGQGD